MWRRIPLLLIVVVAVCLTNFVVLKLTPQLNSITVSSLRKHEVIAEQSIPESNDSLRLEIIRNETTVRNETEKSQIESEISKVRSEVEEIDSLLPLSWFFKFDIKMLFKNAAIKTNDDKDAIGAIELRCNDGNGKLVKIGEVVGDIQDVGLSDFSKRLTNDVKKLLEHCLSSASTLNPLKQYYIKEDYTFEFVPQRINYIITFIIIILGLFGLLPVLRQGVLLNKRGFQYFKE